MITYQEATRNAAQTAAYVARAPRPAAKPQRPPPPPPPTPIRPSRLSRRLSVHYVIVRPDMATHRYVSRLLCVPEGAKGYRRSEDWSKVTCSACLLRRMLQGRVDALEHAGYDQAKSGLAVASAK